MDPTTATENILAWHARADAAAHAYGTTWYRDAQRTARALARDRGTTTRRAAAMIALYSPRCQWGENLRRADLALAGGHQGFRWQRTRAGKLVAGRDYGAILNETGNAPKIRAFYRNITGDLGAVTVDVWAARAAGFDPQNFDYEEVAGAYRAAAETLGVAPATLQAIVWCAIRGRHN